MTSQIGLDQTQRSIALDRWNRIKAAQAANADRLAFVGKAELPLMAECDLFECLAVDGSPATDANVKADNLTILDQ